MQPEKHYPIHQSPLYLLTSKKKLAEVLRCELKELLQFVRAQNNYREFLLPEEVCPFVGKIRKERFVQEPKPELRRVHERLRRLLTRIVPPTYAHAAVRGRSYRTNGLAHVNAQEVATFDIRDFYRSTTSAGVYNFYREHLKCSPDVSSILARLSCSNCGLGRNALPTGSPLSPILSLYANRPLFDELQKIAQRHDLVFTCYVDDVTYSGVKIPYGLSWEVEACVRKHGHRLATSKTKKFADGRSAHVTGLVLHKGEISVPFARFKKARRIEVAIEDAEPGPLQIKMLQQLAGLLGEAAYLDKRFLPWSLQLYRRLREATV